MTADTKEQVSAESWFETGKADEAWEGQWIAPEQQTSSAILRKAFVYDGSAKSARLYMCGLGVYECYINGEKAGDEYLAPGYHSYDFHLQAQTYDVSALLKEGRMRLKSGLEKAGLKEGLVLTADLPIFMETNYMRSQNFMQARSAL